MMKLGKKEVKGLFATVSGICTTTSDIIQLWAKKIPQLGIITTKSIGKEPKEGNIEPILCQISNRSFRNAVGLVDRLEIRRDGYSVAEKLSWLPVTYYSMTNVKTLLPLAYEKLKPSKDLVRKINRYYKKYGCEEVKISI